MLHPQAQALLKLMEERGPAVRAQALGRRQPRRAGELRAPVHGFILMGRVLDEANVVQLCAAQLKLALA
jgi:hypothetical protein